MKSRPPPQKLRQRGILRERVFGCDLGEHLHNSGHEGKFTVQLYLEGFSQCFKVEQILTESSGTLAIEKKKKRSHVVRSCSNKPSVTPLLSPAVPQVVKSCAEFIEKHGVVDGIYRVSGISSNIQKLR